MNNNNNKNAIVNNGQVPSLTELALKAFFRARKELEFEIPSAYNTVIEKQIPKLFPDFLQAIANADPKAVGDFLDFRPELAVIAHGTVTTISGYTYENVSAIQLAYLMDDDELTRDVLLPAIQKLPKEMIEDANTQLVNKMTEVEIQRAQFKPYDFSEMVKAIANDQTLINTGKPNEATQKALAKFKEDFKPGSIREGKSWIKAHLQEAHRVYNENFDLWNRNQLRWYLINVVGHMQTLVEKCFEQECSQRLSEIVGHKKPNARDVKIKNWINDVALTYRGTADSSLVLGRDFFVEIICGAADNQASALWPLWQSRGEDALKNHRRAKASGFSEIKQQLQHSAALHEVNRDTHKSRSCMI